MEVGLLPPQEKQVQKMWYIGLMTGLSRFKLMTKVAVVNKEWLILDLRRSVDDDSRAGC